MGRLSGVLAMILAALLLLPTMAFAKGPSEAVIKGPGIVPTPLRPPGATTIGPALATMVEASGFFPQLWGGGSKPVLSDPPTGNLGPRYEVTYSLDGDGQLRITQYVFPYADEGIVTYMPPGQPVWGTDTAVGGWYLASPRLKELLRDVRLPKKTPARGATPAPHVAPLDPELGESGLPAQLATPGLMVGTLATLLVGVGALLLRRLQFPSASGRSGRF